MPRTSRMLVSDEKAVYHVMSCTALNNFPLEDVERKFMLGLLKRFAALYFTEIPGFCLMGNLSPRQTGNKDRFLSTDWVLRKLEAL